MAADCVVLVPFMDRIDPFCEQGLHALERKGYVVRRVQGISQIDFGRSSLASRALEDGFRELLWIDSDIIFQPSDIEKLRGHEQPFVCGLYAKKTRKGFACEFLPGTAAMTFGRDGGLFEIRYCGFGFVRIRRAVFEAVRERLELPVCNQRYGSAVVPYFLPMVVPDGAGSWYLGEDYAFCERARRCGFAIHADTTIRLGHVGTYAFSWDDVDRPK